MSRRRRYMQGNAPSPIAYQQIEYLEATGGARIKTDYVPNGAGIKIKAKMYMSYNYPESTSYNLFLGATPSESNRNNFLIRRSSDTARNINVVLYSKSSSGLNIANYMNYTQLHTFEIYYDAATSKQTLHEGSGTTYYTAGIRLGNDNDNVLRIFASSDSGANYTNGKIYYLQVYDNENLVLDLIPVRVDTIGYMYDRVGNKLYGNVGTGDFVLGADVTEE